MDNIPFEEWKECRNSIGRFDQIIPDLRKYGFTLITTLISADAFLSKATGLSGSAKLAVSISIMVMILALFVVDRTYEILLEAAVSRAATLERTSEPKMELSATISKRARANHTDTSGIRLYSLLISANAILAVAAIWGLKFWTYTPYQWESTIVLMILLVGLPYLIRGFITKEWFLLPRRQDAPDTSR